MLRRKLLARLGLLVAGFVAGAVVAIALLQNVLRELDASNANAQTMLNRVQSVAASVGDLEMDLADADAMRDGGDRVRARSQAVNTSVSMLAEDPTVKSAGQRLGGYLSALRVRSDAVSEVLEQPLPSPAAVREAASALRFEAAELGAAARGLVAQRQATLSFHLRTLIIGLTIGALVMTNIAIYVLVRTANMILRPVGQLIEGSRQLAREQFGYRIQMANDGEFKELAAAYNSLADELASNEQKKVNALQQLAVTLNHELNNVINGIELQLKLVNRRAGGDPKLSAQLAEIHNNLERIAKTIASLRSVRRVVLTEYMPGQPMLDLPRCTAAEEPAAVIVRPASTPVSGGKP